MHILSHFSFWSHQWQHHVPADVSVTFKTDTQHFTADINRRKKKKSRQWQYINTTLLWKPQCPNDLRQVWTQIQANEHKFHPEKTAIFLQPRKHRTFWEHTAAAKVNAERSCKKRTEATCFIRPAKHTALTYPHFLGPYAHL